MTNSTSADALLHYVNRIEALEEEKAGVEMCIRDR